jgi:hypothetical protein
MFQEEFKIISEDIRHRVGSGSIWKVGKLDPEVSGKLDPDGEYVKKIC